MIKLQVKRKKMVAFIFLLVTMLTITIGCGNDSDNDSNQDNEAVNNDFEESSESQEVQESSNSDSEPQVDFLPAYKVPINQKSIRPADFIYLGELFSSISYEWKEGRNTYKAELILGDNRTVDIHFLNNGGVIKAILTFDQNGNPTNAKLGISFDETEPTDLVDWTDPEDIEYEIIEQRLKNLFSPFEMLLSDSEYMDEALAGEDNYGVHISEKSGPQMQKIDEKQLNTYAITLSYDEEKNRLDEVTFGDFGQFQMMIARKIVAPDANELFIDENGVALDFKVTGFTLNDGSSNSNISLSSSDETMEVSTENNSTDTNSTENESEVPGNKLPEGWPEDIVPLIEGSEIQNIANTDGFIGIEAVTNQSYEEVIAYYKEVLKESKQLVESDTYKEDGVTQGKDLVCYIGDKAVDVSIYPEESGSSFTIVIVDNPNQ